MTQLDDDPVRIAGQGWEAWYDGLHMAFAQQPRPAPLVRAKHYIDREFIEQVPLNIMASKAGLSKYHFVRAFRDIFMQTPHRYQVERRIARARELLERTDMSVTDICFEVGFESVGSFAPRFRQLVGESPTQYRRRFTPQGSVAERAIPACLYEAAPLARKTPSPTPTS
jgi:AraC-like DNA-binding protein